MKTPTFGLLLYIAGGAGFGGGVVRSDLTHRAIYSQEQPSSIMQPDSLFSVFPRRKKQRQRGWVSWSEGICSSLQCFVAGRSWWFTSVFRGRMELVVYYSGVSWLDGIDGLLQCFLTGRNWWFTSVLLACKELVVYFNVS